MGLVWQDPVYMVSGNKELTLARFLYIVLGLHLMLRSDWLQPCLPSEKFGKPGCLPRRVNYVVS